MLPIKLDSMVWEEMFFEEFQDTAMAAILNVRMEQI